MTNEKLTPDEFAFWEKAYLALLSKYGCDSTTINDVNIALNNWKKKRLLVEENKDGPYR